MNQLLIYWLLLLQLQEINNLVFRSRQMRWESLTQEKNLSYIIIIIINIMLIIIIIIVIIITISIISIIDIMWKWHYQFKSQWYDRVFILITFLHLLHGYVLLKTVQNPGLPITSSIACKKQCSFCDCWDRATSRALFGPSWRRVFGGDALCGAVVELIMIAV